MQGVQIGETYIIVTVSGQPKREPGGCGLFLFGGRVGRRTDPLSVTSSSSPENSIVACERDTIKSYLPQPMRTVSLADPKIFVEINRYRSHRP